MRRKPSIHITEDRLSKILMELFEPCGIKRNWKELAKQISIISKKDTLISRSVTISNDKLDKKVNTLLKAKETDSDLVVTSFVRSELGAK